MATSLNSCEMLDDGDNVPGQLDDADSSSSTAAPVETAAAAAAAAAASAPPPSLAAEAGSAIDLTYLGQAALMFSEVSFISPPEGVGCSDAEREGEEEEDNTDFNEDPGDRCIAEQLGIVLNAEGGDPLARMAGLMFSEVPTDTPTEGVGCSDVEREGEGLQEEEGEVEEEDDYDDDDDEEEEEGKSDLGLAADYHSRRRRRKKPSFYRRCFRKTALSTSSPSDSRPTGAAFPSSVAQLGGGSCRNGGSSVMTRVMVLSRASKMPSAWRWSSLFLPSQHRPLLTLFGLGMQHRLPWPSHSTSSTSLL